MPKNKMCDLRDHLFAALEGLADEEKPMDVDRAQAVANVAKEIINSAKVELTYLKLVGSDLLPRGVDPEATARFLEEEKDPRINPNVKGLGTGRNLGEPVAVGNGKH